MIYTKNQNTNFIRRSKPVITMLLMAIVFSLLWFNLSYAVTLSDASRVYNGSDLSIGVTGNTAGTTVYSVSTDNGANYSPWLTTLPTRNQVGETLVRAKDNREATTVVGPKKITITQADSTITLGTTSNSITYDEIKTFTVKANLKGRFEITSSDRSKVRILTPNSGIVNANTNFTVSYKGTGATTSNVTITAKFIPTDTTDYKQSTTSFTTTVAKAASVAPVLTGYSGPYDGANHSVQSTAGFGGQIQYRTSSTADWINGSPTLVTRADVGTTTVYARVLGDANHNNSAEASGTITITKISVPEPYAYQNIIYSGIEQAGIPASNYYNVTNGSKTNAGSYNATVSLKSSTNLQWADGTTGNKTVAWSIAKRPVYVYADNKHKYQGDENPTLTYRVVNEAKDTSARVTGELETAAAPGSAIGNYDINQGTVKIGDTTNYTLNFVKGKLFVKKALGADGTESIRVSTLLDTTAPTVSVPEVTSYDGKGNLTLRVASATDNGSGLDRLEFTVTVNQTTEYTKNIMLSQQASVSNQSVTFHVPLQSSYSFQVVAVDAVGNRTIQFNSYFYANNITIVANNQTIYKGQEISSEPNDVRVTSGMLQGGESIKDVVLEKSGTKIVIQDFKIVDSSDNETYNHVEGFGNYNVTLNDGTVTEISRELGAGGKVVIDEVTDEYVYDNINYTPKIKVSWTGYSPYDGHDISVAQLVEGTDYTVAYSNNKEAGYATVTVTGKGNYSGTLVTHFIIKPRNVIITAMETTRRTGNNLPVLNADFITYGLEPNTFTGSSNATSMTPGFTGTMYVNNKTPLVLGTYPILKGTFEINANTSTGFKLSNFYSTFEEGTFIVNNTSLTDPSIVITFDRLEYNYDGQPHRPVETVVDTTINQTLTKGTDYTVAYYNDVNVQESNADNHRQTVVITGIGNYSGSRTQFYVINPIDATVRIHNKTKEFNTPNAVLTYTLEGLIQGESLDESSIVLETTCTTDSLIGTYPITLKADSKLKDSSPYLARNYNLKSVQGTYTVSDVAIDTDELKTFINPKQFIYNGVSQIPTDVIVKDTRGRTLTRYVDYDVDFFDTVNITNRPTYNTRAVITGINNYASSGKITRYYDILPKPMTGSMDISFYPEDSITHGPIVGSVLTANVVMVDPMDPNITYQWYKSTSDAETVASLTEDKAIAGATSVTYTAKLEDYDYYLYCVAICTKENYQKLTLMNLTKATDSNSPSKVVERGIPTINVAMTTSDGREYTSGTWTNYDIRMNVTATDNKFIRRIEHSNDGENFSVIASNSDPTKTTLTVQVVASSETDSTKHYFRTYDDVGNVSETVEVEVRIDKKAPTITEITKVPDGWTNTDVEVTGKAIDDSDTAGCLGSGISKYYFGDNQNPTLFEEVAATYSFEQIITYTENKYNQWMVVVDQAGNIAKLGYNVGNIDKIPPTEIINVTRDPDDNVVLNIKAFDNEGGSGLNNVKVNGEIVPVNLGGDGQYAGTYEIREPGEYVVVAEDNTGNKSTEWILNVYGIIYRGNGALGTMASSLKLEGETVIIKNCEFVSEDAEFVSWNTTPDGKGTIYAPGGTYSANSTITLYAQWSTTTLELDRVVLSGYDFEYTGSPITPQEKVYNKQGKLLTRDVDYTIVYENNVNKGIANVIIIGLGKYLDQRLDTHFNIGGINIEVDINAKLDKEIYVYDATEKKPTATVMYGSEQLKAGRDYVIEYKDNIEVGTPTATITGRGRYFGEIVLPFTIIRAERKVYAYDVAMIVGEEVNLSYTYDGEHVVDATNNPIDTLTLTDTTYASISKDINNRFVITGVHPGKTTMEYYVPETKNYKAGSAVVQVTVFNGVEDSVPLYGTIIINDDDEYTNTPRVLLTIGASRADYMYISESNSRPTVDDPNWTDFSTKLPYNFGDDTPDGQKVIYAWFKDKKGNMSNLAMDTIILDRDHDLVEPYDQRYVAHDQIMLDKTEIDKTKPTYTITNYSNSGLQITLKFEQNDVLVNGTRSGVDKTTIGYGIREYDNNSRPLTDTFTWQNGMNNNVINNLAYGKIYGIATRAKDKAGNGLTVSEELIITMPLKQGTIITLKDKQAQVNGLVHELDEESMEYSQYFALIDGKPITGEVTFTYYRYYNGEDDCVLTTPARDGSITVGGAPSEPGTYYVVCRLRDDNNYFDVDSNVAELRIGWYIHKDDGSEIFAYVDETGKETDEYVLHITGEGNMKDLEDIKQQNDDPSLTYWVDFLDKIVELVIHDDDENTINNIGADVFSDLTKITEIIIPDSINEIGDGAFNGDSSVNTKVVIPSDVEVIGKNPFVDTKVPEFEVLDGNPNYTSVDGLIYSKDETEIIAYPGGKVEDVDEDGYRTYVIPEGVEDIHDEAFKGSDNLERVIIPDGVTNIGEKAFDDCNNLMVIEIDDLFERADNTIDLIDEEGNVKIGKDAFGDLPEGSSIYTFDKRIADLLEPDYHYDSTKTTVYWPPEITLHPIDANGTTGAYANFFIEAKDGYIEGIRYLWHRRESSEAISKAENPGRPYENNNASYNTPILNASNEDDQYFCAVYNYPTVGDYYFVNYIDKVTSSHPEYASSRLFSEPAKLIMLTNMYYRVERIVNGIQYDYLFDNLQDAFDFSISEDKIRVIQDVPSEASARLTGNKDVELILDHKINLVGTISLESGSRITLTGNTEIDKAGGFIFENDGELILDGAFKLVNTNGGAIKNNEESILTFNSGNIETARTAITAKDADVTITSSNARIVVEASVPASAIEIEGYTRLIISDVNILVKNGEASPAPGEYAGIINNAQDNIATGKGKVTINGGTINVTAESGIGVLNKNSADLIIEEGGGKNITITGARSGIENSPTNNNGNVEVKNGSINGGQYGILNNASQAKVILGTKDGNYVRSAPVITGEEVAIFNTRTTNTLEFYDGVLRAKSDNIIYEDINNTTLTRDPNHKERVYTATGRKPIITEDGYIIENDVEGSYYIAFLAKRDDPVATIADPDPIMVGEQTTLDVEIHDEDPHHQRQYTYEWEVSIDNGVTWIKVTSGYGYETKSYTIPPATLAMDGYLYRCKVTSNTGWAYTNVVKLTVVEDVAYRDQRPIVRIIYSNENKGVYYKEGADPYDTSSPKIKYSKMQIIITTIEELKEAKFTFSREQEELLNLPVGSPKETSTYKLTNLGMTSITTNAGYTEYKYTYDMEAYVNGIITVKATDITGREGSGSQTIDTLFNLEVRYTVSTLDATNTQLVITFFANKQVKEPIEGNSVNGRLVTLQKVDSSEYSYKWIFKPTEPIESDTYFYFVDEFGNKARVLVDSTLRVKYKDVKFTDDETNVDIRDLTIVDAYNVARNLEKQTEVMDSMAVQSKYGVNKVQAEMFMARARDVGAVEMLSGASESKSYDGKNLNNITATQSEESAYDYVSGTRNNYVSTIGDASTNKLNSESRNYVDIIDKADTSLYKGADYSGFSSDNTAESYMFEDTTGRFVNTPNDVYSGTFRAVIVGN